MSVQVIILMTVTLTLCVPTLMDLMCVAVLEAMREMAKTVQVFFSFFFVFVFVAKGPVGLAATMIRRVYKKSQRC